MSDVKLCPNGHYYPNSELQCPYCPKPAAAGADQTMAVEHAAAGDGKTQVFNNQQRQHSGDAGKTQIFTSGSPASGGQAAWQGLQEGRRLVGWLVTYDFNPMGRDYRVIEGRNTIGQSKERDIPIDLDSKISSHHLTILYRLGEFSFKDELSTNGTFHNGVLTNEGKLKDGDEVRIGDTKLLLRTALK